MGRQVGTSRYRCRQRNEGNSIVAREDRGTTTGALRGFALVRDMPIYDADEDNYCEGCMVRNTGDNFAHPAFCRACMAATMEAPPDEILKGNEHLTGRLAANADAKVGALTSWRDTDGAEVEIVLPLPPGVGKKELRVKASVGKLLVAAGERRLLFVDPLYDEVVPDEMVWCIERAPDGTTQMQLSLVKAHPGTRWGKTLNRDGGVLEAWQSQLLPPTKGGAEAGEGDAASQESAPAAANPRRPRPRFTMRDDGAEVEVNLPLPVGSVGSGGGSGGAGGGADLQVSAKTRSVTVRAGGRQLLHVAPLVADIVPDELMCARP